MFVTIGTNCRFKYSLACVKCSKQLLMRFHFIEDFAYVGSIQRGSSLGFVTEVTCVSEPQSVHCEDVN